MFQRAYVCFQEERAERSHGLRPPPYGSPAGPGSGPPPENKLAKQGSLCLLRAGVLVSVTFPAESTSGPKEDCFSPSETHFSQSRLQRREGGLPGSSPHRPTPLRVDSGSPLHEQPSRACSQHCQGQPDLQGPYHALRGAKSACLLAVASPQTSADRTRFTPP